MKYFNYFFIIISFLIFFHPSLNPQVTEQWVSRYNGTGNGRDQIFDMVLDNTGNVYVTGYSLGSSANYDWVTIKYNQYGDSVWVKRYFPLDNISDDWAYSISLDRQNTGQFIYVTGYQYTSSESFIDYVTIKYNQNGDTIWKAVFSGPGNQDDKAYSIGVDNTGNVYVTGTSMNNTGAYDYVTLKYNSSGVQQWLARYNGTGNSYDYGHALAVDDTGNVYVTGWSWGTSSFADCATIKYNTDGVQKWVARYNGPGNGNEQSVSIVLDKAGNVYIAGNSTGSTGNIDAIVIKYNNAGAQQWVSRYDGAANNYDAYMSVAFDSRQASSYVYATGNTYTGSVNMNDLLTVKNNAQTGDTQWVKLYNGISSNRDYGNSITLDSSGNVYVTGRGPVSSGDEDIITIKYNEQGILQWVKTYDGPGHGADNGQVIKLDKQNNIYVSGWSYGVGTGQADYLTIKYSTTTCFKRISNVISGEYKLFQNYPNPFNSKTNIIFQVPDEGIIELRIFDIIGQQAATPVNEYLTRGIYEIIFDASVLASGTYYYQLSTGNYLETKKMLLIK